MTSKIVSGIVALGEIIAQKKQIENPVGNAGSNFENNTFAIRAYCWCEGELKEHEEGCPLNFEYKKEGKEFGASWYKHIHRGFRCDDISADDWLEIFSDCLASLKEEDMNNNKKWTKIAGRKGDHRLFRDENNCIAIADQSGATPDQTDEGPLYLKEEGTAVVHFSEFSKRLMVNYELEEGKRTTSGLHVLPALREYGYSIKFSEEVIEDLGILGNILNDGFGHVIIPRKENPILDLSNRRWKAENGEEE